jgi:hypothetical protein
MARQPTLERLEVFYIILEQIQQTPLWINIYSSKLLQKTLILETSPIFNKNTTSHCVL